MMRFRTVTTRWFRLSWRFDRIKPWWSVRYVGPTRGFERDHWFFISYLECHLTLPERWITITSEEFFAAIDATEEDRP